MKNLFLAAVFVFSPSIFAQNEKEWMGYWVSKKLICPFGCSPLMRGIFEKSKSKKFQFTADTIIDASGMSADCQKPSKPDYTGLKIINVKKYLLDGSQNEQAIEQPKIIKKLPKLLGFKPNQKVTAGVIHCLGADGNVTTSNQNIIFVDAKKALARFEENAYWELSR